tara:strand:- start:90 stop:203 length:114 start_codon:yes stop_codon:yes gene_type:complete
MAENIAQVASIVYPTGISGITASYTYPNCSNLLKTKR